MIVAKDRLPALMEFLPFSPVVVAQIEGKKLVISKYTVDTWIRI
jgi:hypothetical protein